MSTPVEPLTPGEEATWRALARLLVVLPRALDDDLVRRAGLGMTTYVVLMSLSEAPGRQLRMSELAARATLSPSRMTRVVDALERDGFVERATGAQDARTNVARLTDAGLVRLEEAWPSHLAGVRRIVLDHVDDRGLERVSSTLAAITAGIEDTAPTAPCDQRM